MTKQLAETCCAELPAASLAHLGPLRAHAELSGFVSGQSLWLFWPAGQIELAREILAVGGSELYLRRGQEWYRPQEHLPVFHVPAGRDTRPLSALLFPEPVTPTGVGTATYRPAPLALVRSGVPMKASALLVEREQLLRWADHATRQQIRAVLAARCGEEVLLRIIPGIRPGLPTLDCERFWGFNLFLPLGMRLEPALSESVLRDALGLQTHEIALWRLDGFEIIAAEAFEPLTRASIRLFGNEGRP